MRPRLLDLYCGAGGAGHGYKLAGFDVTGVDIRAQPRYAGDRFIQADALAYLAAHGREYDYIHASPPCQAYSRMRRIIGPGKEYPDLVGPTRDLLLAVGRPYVIENVEGAPLVDYIVLCGTTVGLRVRRHRLFEMRPLLPILVAPCSCRNGVATGRLIGQRLRGRKPANRRVPPRFSEAEKRDAIGVPWMSLDECQEAIPPAYTHLLGGHMLDYLGTVDRGKA